MTVLDASVVIDYLLGEPFSPAGQAVADRRHALLSVPHLIDAEVGQTVRRLHLAGLLDLARGRAMLTDLAALSVERFPQNVAGLQRCLDLRDNLSFYDATYVVLAEQLGVPLLTADEKLADAPGVDVEVIYAASGG